MWLDFNSNFQYGFTVCWLNNNNHQHNYHHHNHNNNNNNNNNNKVNNGNTKAICQICSKLTITTAEWYRGRRSGVFDVNFEQVSHTFFWHVLSIAHLQQVNPSGLLKSLTDIKNMDQSVFYFLQKINWFLDSIKFDKIKLTYQWNC